jgi:hypothetical protein
MRRILVMTALALTLVLGAAQPASAQDSNRTRQQGLVNVAATDTTVQVPIGVAANVCGVAVNVLSRAANLGDVDCTADGVALAENDSDNGNNRTRQNGLINVALTDTTVQVPVAVAANVCGVAVNVLAAAGNFGDVSCDAFADSGASN